MIGWFPVPHDIVDSPIFHDAETLRLFIWLSKRAAIKTQYVPMTTGRGQTVVTLERGQCIVGRKQSAIPLDWTESRFRYRLLKLEKHGIIRRICATHWTIVEVVNYGVCELGEENTNQPNNQPNATQTTNQTPQRKKTKKTKKTEEALADKSAVQDHELNAWIELWNSLKSEGLVSAGTSPTPNKGVRAGWKRVKQSKELRPLLEDRQAIESAIRTSEFVRGTWFTLEKLFGGTNKDGAYIVQKLLDGCYRQSSSPARTANVGPGVTFSPVSPKGDPNYGKM